MSSAHEGDLKTRVEVVTCSYQLVMRFKKACRHLNSFVFKKKKKDIDQSQLFLSSYVHQSEDFSNIWKCKLTKAYCVEFFGIWIEAKWVCLWRHKSHSWWDCVAAKYVSAKSDLFSMNNLLICAHPDRTLREQKGKHTVSVVSVSVFWRQQLLVKWVVVENVLWLAFGWQDWKGSVVFTMQTSH